MSINVYEIGHKNRKTQSQIGFIDVGKISCQLESFIRFLAGIFIRIPSKKCQLFRKFCRLIGIISVFFIIKPKIKS
jgi:hypothetical protein